MFYFVSVVHFFVNYAIFREFCDRMRFEVDCAKSYYRIISEGLYNFFCNFLFFLLHFVNMIQFYA